MCKNLTEKQFIGELFYCSVADAECLAQFLVPWPQFCHLTCCDLSLDETPSTLFSFPSDQVSQPDFAILVLSLWEASVQV